MVCNYLGGLNDCGRALRQIPQCLKNVKFVAYHLYTALQIVL